MDDKTSSATAPAEAYCFWALAVRDVASCGVQGKGCNARDMCSNGTMHARVHGNDTLNSNNLFGCISLSILSKRKSYSKHNNQAAESRVVCQALYNGVELTVAKRPEY